MNTADPRYKERVALRVDFLLWWEKYGKHEKPVYSANFDDEFHMRIAWKAYLAASDQNPETQTTP